MELQDALEPYTTPIKVRAFPDLVRPVTVAGAARLARCADCQVLKHGDYAVL